MPVTIERDPISELVQFHRVIRNMLKEVRALGQIDEAKRAEAAPSIVSCLTGSIVWHDIDEEVSVFTRLRNQSNSKRMDAVLKDCSMAHEALENRIADFLGILENKAATPGVLTQGGRDLAQILEPHLVMEEQELFPFARLVFDEEDLQKIRSEMDHRAQKRASGQKSVVALG